MLRPPRTSAHSAPGRSPGFTIIELMVVITLVGLVAAISIGFLTATRQRDAISLGPAQLASAWESARNHALSSAREVLFVMIDNPGPVQAARCGATGPGELDPNCVRYWIVEDLSGVVPGDRFLTTAQLRAFNPATITQVDLGAPRGKVLVTDQGDIVLERGYLPRPLTIGRHAGFTALAPPAGSALTGLGAPAVDCTFCDTGVTPMRAIIRFNTEGQAVVGIRPVPPLPPLPRGGVMYLTTAPSLNQTRGVAILQPSGVIVPWVQ